MYKSLLAVSCFVPLVGCAGVDDGRWRAYESAVEYRELTRQAEAEARAQEAESYKDEQPTVVIETPEGVKVTVNLAPSVRAAVTGQRDRRPEPQIPQPKGIIAETFEAVGDLAGSIGPWALPWAIASEFRKAPRGVEVSAETATFDGSFNTEEVHLTGEGNKYALDESTEEILLLEGEGPEAPESPEVPEAPEAPIE